MIFRKIAGLYLALSDQSCCLIPLQGLIELVKFDAALAWKVHAEPAVGVYVEGVHEFRCVRLVYHAFVQCIVKAVQFRLGGTCFCQYAFEVVEPVV